MLRSLVWQREYSHEYVFNLELRCLNTAYVSKISSRLKIDAVVSFYNTRARP